MSAIEQIGNALRYDAVEFAIMTSFANALALAAMVQPELTDDEHAPVSTDPTVPCGK